MSNWLYSQCRFWDSNQRPSWTSSFEMVTIPLMSFKIVGMASAFTSFYFKNCRSSSRKWKVSNTQILTLQLVTYRVHVSFRFCIYWSGPILCWDLSPACFTIDFMKISEFFCISLWLSSVYVIKMRFCSFYY
jgi:hypothetical protein